MNHLALFSMLADSLRVWAPISVFNSFSLKSLRVWASISVFNSFSLKMSIMHFVRVTIEVQKAQKLQKQGNKTILI